MSEPIRPSSWRVSISQHERWERVDPGAICQLQFVGYEWRCEGQVEGVQLPLSSSYYHFRLMRPGCVPHEWIGIFHLGHTNSDQELIDGKFQAVEDGRTRFPSEAWASSADVGAVLELWPVEVEHATGRFVDAPFALP